MNIDSKLPTAVIRYAEKFVMRIWALQGLQLTMKKKVVAKRHTEAKCVWHRSWICLPYKPLKMWDQEYYERTECWVSLPTCEMPCISVRDIPKARGYQYTPTSRHKAIKKSQVHKNPEKISAHVYCVRVRTCRTSTANSQEPIFQLWRDHSCM
jgi:hypothetical protein